MPITHTNLVSELDFTVSEFLLALAQLKEIQQDTPATHDTLLLLNGRVGQAMDVLQELIDFIGTEKPDTSLVDNRFKSSLELMTEVLKEKTRIIKNTLPIIYQTNDASSLN